MIGSLSIRSKGQCSSAVQLNMHNRRRKGLPDYDHSLLYTVHILHHILLRLFFTIHTVKKDSET